MNKDKNQRRIELNKKGVQFAVDLLNTINKTQQQINIIISPLAIQLAVGLSYLAAGSKTREEMVKCLRFPNDRSENIDMLARILCKYGQNANIRLACKFFVERSLTIKSGALESFGRLSKIAIHRIDFTQPRKAAKTINNWVKTKTQNKVKEVVKPSELADTHLIIVSAIYFSMPWKLEFGTNSGEFWVNGKDSMTVPMMTQAYSGVRSANIRELKCQSLELPFEDEDHIMLIVLPNSKTGINALLAALPNFDFLEFRRRLNYNFLYITMPKFRIEASNDLIEPLIKMGMKSAFTKPDFSKFFENSDGLAVKKVVHKTFIEMTEKGSPPPDMSGGTDPPSCAGVIEGFSITHPFLYAIMSKHNRVLLMGTVRNPLDNLVSAAD